MLRLALDDVERTDRLGRDLRANAWTDGLTLLVVLFIASFSAGLMVLTVHHAVSAVGDRTAARADAPLLAPPATGVYAPR